MEETGRKSFKHKNFMNFLKKLKHRKWKVRFDVHHNCSLDDFCHEYSESGTINKIEHTNFEPAYPERKYKIYFSNGKTISFDVPADAVINWDKNKYWLEWVNDGPFCYVIISKCFSFFK